MKIYATVLLLLVLSACGCKGGDIVLAQKPLYEEEGQWCLWTALPGSHVVYNFYERPKQRVESHGGALPDGFGRAFQHMQLTGPHKFLAFVVRTAPGVTTFWPKNAVIVVHYSRKGKHYEAISEDFFVINQCELTIVEPQGMLQLPSAQSIFSTPSQNPILFAQFTFSVAPDTILYCTVSNVLAKGGDSR